MLGAGRVCAFAGNYIIIKFDDGIYAALCHLQTGSIQVSVGQKVTKGEMIGKMGYSGNFFAPHLHFQLMDSNDIASANGIPCAFEEYELFKNGKWERVKNGNVCNHDYLRKYCSTLFQMGIDNDIVDFTAKTIYSVIYQGSRGLTLVLCEGLYS